MYSMEVIPGFVYVLFFFLSETLNVMIFFLPAHIFPVQYLSIVNLAAGVENLSVKLSLQT